MRSGLALKIVGFYKGLRTKNLSTLAASVSFFAFLSLFPFFVLLVSLASLFFNQKAVLPKLEPLLRTFPKGVVETVTNTLKAALSQGKVVSVLSFVLLAIASYAVFGQLQTALNSVFRAQKVAKSWIRTLRTFVFFVAFALILLGLLLAGGTILFLSSKLKRLPLLPSLFLVEGSTILVEVLLISFSYRYLAFKMLAWRNVFIGGLVASVGWEILRLLFGLYVSLLGGGTAIYGTIGSVFLLMLWLYYSVIIYLVGAHVSVEIE